MAVVNFDTDTSDANNGFAFDGDAEVNASPPLAATPATVEPVRVMARSTPPTTMSGGQPS